MIYIDKDLCTGCGACIAACNRGALSLIDGVAVINEALCTSCGLCAESCASGAIISMEVDPPPPITTPVQGAEAQPLRAGVSASLPSHASAAPVASESEVPGAASKFEIVEKVFNGLFTIATFMLDRGRGRSTWPTGVDRRAGKTFSSRAGRAGGCSRGGVGRGTGQVQRLGGGPGGGRGLGGAGRGSGRRRSNKRNRAK
ncbi:MAG: DUF362 domain-containing protein [Thermoleophilia bacterium]|jgi:NAD-dependent dihydropyrimidine dehydrogenase PreA subunit